MYVSKFIARFNAKLSILNGWVGIYKNNNDKLFMMWVYTGCKNVEGGQDEQGVLDEDKINNYIQKRRRSRPHLPQEIS